MRLSRLSLASWLLLAASAPLHLSSLGAQATAAPAVRTAPSTGTRAITHPDLWRMKRVGAPAVSPDGKWAVVSVLEPSYDAREQTSDLWIVPTDGGAEPRKLTSTRGGEGGATWSRDSKRIAFTASRDGDTAPQVYVLDLDGGEARRVTSAATGARAPRWSPDGQAILYTSNVWPGATDDDANRRIAAERAALKYRARAYETFPIRNWDRWRDDQRPALWVQPLAAGAKARNLLAGTRLAAAPGFSGTMGSGSEDLPATWTPDGRSVLFLASTEWDQAARKEVAFQLYQVSVDGGEPTTVLGEDGEYGVPQFSRDGRRIVTTFGPANDRTYNDTHLVSFTWPALGERTQLTRSLDRPVRGYGISPDGRTVWFLAEDAGRDRLYSVPIGGGTATRVIGQAQGTYAGLSVTGTAAPVLVATFESASRPPEVVRIDAGARRHAALTRFTAEQVAGLDLPPLRELTHTSAGGKTIQSFVALPPDFDESKKYPLFVVIHGGPHGAWKDQWVLRWNYHLLAAPGYVVLLTNYTGSPGFGEKFAQGVQGDPLKTLADEVNEAADEAIRRFPFVDSTRQVAGGASYGGHLAFWLQGTTTRYKALISHAGAINPESQWGTSDAIYGREVNFGGPVWERGPVWREQSAALRAPAFRTPILITVGEQDFRVPVNNSLEAYALMQRMKVPARLVVFPEENHWVLNGENSRYFYSEVHGWIERWLKAPATVGTP